MDRGGWQATVHGGCKELDTTKRLRCLFLSLPSQFWRNQKLREGERETETPSEEKETQKSPPLLTHSRSQLSWRRKKLSLTMKIGVVESLHWSGPINY